MAACLSYFLMKPVTLDRVAAAFGILVTLAMVLVKVLPIVPGHFTLYEWLAVAIWAALGVLVRIPVKSGAAPVLAQPQGSSHQ
jgi:uncharacterized membrane protein YbhN (UPF0104 family)